MTNETKQKDNTDLIEYLQHQGYSNVIELPGRGVCGLMRMVFTTGLFYNMDEFSYKGRYCFGTYSEAKEGLMNWSGINDPEGNWIKHKGHTEYSNPKNLANN